MNRFKTKKKAKDDSASARPSLESESSFSLFGWRKRPQDQDSKREINLATVLPPSDDFRTSLLMAGLSARFSMLREQDDPTTKIGKASDDSVLFPKRQSRMADLGFGGGNGLGDIAEVESIKAPTLLRTESIASEDSNSMMTRSRPTEGNVLFGGRQKIYKITAGTSSPKNISDVMGGRALYDDDVAMSAFQRWRQIDRVKLGQSLDGDDEDDGNSKSVNDHMRAVEDTRLMSRSESPLPHGYDKKRETSSTTSSTPPSGGRNSTAATSVTSQPTTLPKDAHFQQSPTTSSVVIPALERHVSRTRKLYEPGLTQDLQEQQNSTLSRMDTLTRRLGGVGSPDMGSPIMHSFADRFGERRALLSKGSAPNLRSIDSSTTISSKGTMDLSSRMSNTAESKSSVTSSPPLFSPPFVSPTSDYGTAGHICLPIQPRDQGKATAMGVFQRPTQTYNDVKFAERQLQLQRGRETPTPRVQKDSTNTFLTTLPSRPTVFNRQQESEFRTAAASTTPEHDTVSDPPLHQTIESPILNEHDNAETFSPRVVLERPSDQDHPAFRHSAIPTPLSFAKNLDKVQPPPRKGDSKHMACSHEEPLLGDSPTLGPIVGLGGMVRQHLRMGSDVSSIFGSQEPVLSPNSQWQEQCRKGGSGGQGYDCSPRTQTGVPEEDAKGPKLIKPKDISRLDAPNTSDQDEFANQLASARRRVREKLTSFVETDNTPCFLSPQLQPDLVGDLAPPPGRSNPLGILRGKGSRGSLIDRGRDAASKSSKILGIGAVTMATSPVSVKHDFDDQDRRRPLELKEHTGERNEEAASGWGLEREEREDSVHSGLRAFSQARPELQKRQETERTARRHNQNDSAKTRQDLARSPSRECQPAGPLQQRSTGGDSSAGAPPPPPRSQSRTANPRSGSGSEGSVGQTGSRSRPPPRRQSSKENPEELRLNLVETQGPRLRSPGLPGLPGTDIRRSPHMPQIRSVMHSGHQPAQPGPHDDRMKAGSGVAGNYLGRSTTEPLPVSLRSGGYEPSRTHFLSSRTAGSEPPTQTTNPPPRRPSIPTNPHAGAGSRTANDSMKRPVNKNDISEPKFLMSSSRVPTVNLPQSTAELHETRSRSGSRSGSGNKTGHGSPPPLPPVNPLRRRHSSRTRTVAANSPLAHNGGGTKEKSLNISTPQLSLGGPLVAPFAESPVEDGKSFNSFGDDDRKPVLRRLRKVGPEVKTSANASVAGPKWVSPPQTAIGTAAVRTVMRSNMPGGMF